MYDVTIIGAGVIGALTARLLSSYKLNVCVIEKEADIAMGTTKANSAIVHAGYDAKPGTLKAKLNVKGNAMMGEVTKDLDVPFKRNGSFVLAFNDEDKEALKELYNNGLENNVPGIEILESERVFKMEPNLSKEIVGALYAPSAGIVCPYELTVGAMEVAVSNGTTLLMQHEVKEIDKKDDSFVIKTSKGDITTKTIINAAGVHADKISKLVGDDSYQIHPRKGEYMLLDKNQGNIIDRVMFQPPSKYGKGILVTPTVDGNLLIGPTALDIEDKEDVATSNQGLSNVLEGAKKSVPSFNPRDVITSFAGLRAVGSSGDFIIGYSKASNLFINAAGIESPGLSAAPAIAEYVVELLSNELELDKKSDVSLERKPVLRFRELNNEERIELIKKDKRYGQIICRCETVTEGEIVDCINRPAGATNLDAVKRRTRAGMGRCQGGFCSPRVVDILSRELNIPMEEVTKHGEGSNILVGKTK